MVNERAGGDFKNTPRRQDEYYKPFLSDVMGTLDCVESKCLGEMVTEKFFLKKKTTTFQLLQLYTIKSEYSIGIFADFNILKHNP